MILKLKRKGKFYDCLIDDEDFEKISEYKCYVDSIGYVRCFGRKNKDEKTGQYKYLPLHTLVMGKPEYPKVGIDHINGNKLDNRKCNLRFCTRSENQSNRKPGGKSKYLGVHEKYSKYKSRVTGKITRKFCGYESNISSNGEYFYLGFFKDEVDAAKAYNDGAKKYHGEFANLNKI